MRLFRGAFVDVAPRHFSPNWRRRVGGGFVLIWDRCVAIARDGPGFRRAIGSDAQAGRGSASDALGFRADVEQSHQHRCRFSRPRLGCRRCQLPITRGGNRKFPRIEEADRIKILEDTDADGKADKVTVFADRIFPVPMGIAVEEHFDRAGQYTGCRVFVGNSPDLLVLEDTDGDDKADKRYVLLTGFGGVDSDHGVHGMALGIDGKLYFTHGDGCCSVQHDHSEKLQNFDVVDRSGRHVWTDQLANTLRVNRDGTQFEIVCDRQRNNYETCMNSFGNVFTSDNDDDGNRGCRVIWAMDGGHYGYKTPGSPRHWGEEVPGNVPKIVGTGNGSPCGIMVYEGDLLPPEYRGAVFEVDAGSRQVNHFPLTRKGAAFQTQYKVMLGSDDRWFRPVDACTAPDGSVFVADWYDAGVGGHAFRDQTSGRIYRVAPRDTRARSRNRISGRWKG